MAALAAASKPSTSAVGSASAYPSAVASSSASWKLAPDESMLDRMKLVVPLTMPVTRGDPVAVQRLAQRAQQRDGPGHRGLVVQVGVALGRGVVQRRPVLGQQGLVGGDHALARAQRLDQPRPGRFDPADHLDDDVDVVALDQAERVGGEQRRVDRQRRRGRGPAGARRRPTSSSGAPMRACRSSACSRSSRTTSPPTTPQPSSATRTGAPRPPHRCCSSPTPHPARGGRPRSPAARSPVTRRRATAMTGGRGTWL